jgi:hypothetical protein
MFKLIFAPNIAPVFQRNAIRDFGGIKGALKR